MYIYVCTYICRSDRWGAGIVLQRYEEKTENHTPVLLLVEDFEAVRAESHSKNFYLHTYMLKYTKI